jgi:predicted nucleotidyltransferase
MIKTFSTSKLDQVLSDRSLKNEQDRQILLQKTKEWLNQNAHQYGMTSAYIFGSVTRPYRFHRRSDVDLAVETIDQDQFCLVISLLATFLEREVDLIQLKHCHFANKIRQTGILWIATQGVIFESDLLAQLELIKRIAAQLEQRAAGLRSDDIIRLESVAYQIHNLYNAVEDLLKIVATYFENNITDTAQYYTALLKRMNQIIPKIRPALISEETFVILNGLRGFRHFSSCLWHPH